LSHGDHRPVAIVDFHLVVSWELRDRMSEDGRVVVRVDKRMMRVRGADSADLVGAVRELWTSWYPWWRDSYG
jgi:hypothetical protein